MKRTFVIALASILALSATACNTVRGAGQDLESAADTVDEAT